MAENKMPDQRMLALDILLLTEDGAGFSSQLTEAALTKYDYLPAEQKGFIRRLCDGCVRERLYLDYCIDSISKTKTRQMKKLIRVLLRMGAYQLLRMDDIPASAAVNEAVKLARKRGFASLSGFVNGVLRNLDRRKAEILLPEKSSQREQYLSVKYSMPLWLVDEIEEGLGKKLKTESEKVFDALLQKRPLCMRLSERLDENAKEKLLRDMQESGVEIRQHKKLANAYFLKNVRGIEQLPGYEEGAFYLQDPGSVMVVEKAGISAGDFVIDVCAAPGGKALHAADKLAAMADGKAPGEVLARDLSLEKVERIRENISRFGLSNIRSEVHDATSFDPKLEGKADVVLADLPCSGLGVLGRKPDIKYRLSPDQIAELSFLQRDILKTVSAYVKKGGILMYSTCTLSKMENEDNRDWILQNLPFTKEEEVKLLPGRDDSDGFYMLRMRRK